MHLKSAITTLDVIRVVMAANMIVGANIILSFHLKLAIIVRVAHSRLDEYLGMSPPTLCILEFGTELLSLQLVVLSRVLPRSLWKWERKLRNN